MKTGGLGFPIKTGIKSFLCLSKCIFFLSCYLTPKREVSPGLPQGVGGVAGVVGEVLLTKTAEDQGVAGAPEIESNYGNPSKILL